MRQGIAVHLCIENELRIEFPVVPELHWGLHATPCIAICEQDVEREALLHYQWGGTSDLNKEALTANIHHDRGLIWRPCAWPRVLEESFAPHTYGDRSNRASETHDVHIHKGRRCTS
eukprot:5777678-Prymnesium_polylepis.2